MPLYMGASDVQFAIWTFLCILTCFLKQSIHFLFHFCENNINRNVNDIISNSLEIDELILWFFDFSSISEH